MACSLTIHVGLQAESQGFISVASASHKYDMTMHLSILGHFPELFQLLTH